MDDLRQEIDHVIKVFFLLLDFIGESQFISDDRTDHMEMEKIMPELFKRLAESSSKYLTYKHPKLKEVLPQAALFDCISKKLKKQTIETTRKDPFEKIATRYRNGPDLIGDFYKQLHSVCDEYLSEKDNKMEFKYRCDRYNVSTCENNLEQAGGEVISQKKREKKHRRSVPKDISSKNTHHDPGPQTAPVSSPQPAQVNLTISVLPSDLVSKTAPVEQSSSTPTLEPVLQQTPVPRPVSAEFPAPTSAPQPVSVQQSPSTPPLVLVFQSPLAQQPASVQQPVFVLPSAPAPAPQPVLAQQPSASAVEPVSPIAPIPALPPVPAPTPVPTPTPAPVRLPQPVSVQQPPSISPLEPILQPTPAQQPVPVSPPIPAPQTVPALPPAPVAQPDPVQQPPSIPPLEPILQPAPVQQPAPALPPAPVPVPRTI